jgi:hypothetical protein
MMERLKENQKFHLSSYRKPFWRVMGLHGWWFLLFGVFTTFSFILGLFFGETTFIIPSKTSAAISVSFINHPFWFCFIMAINGVISFIIWALFFQWLRNRNTKL